MKRLDAANDNDVGKQIAYSRQVWQPRVGRDLTDEDARQISEDVTGFFAILAEWSQVVWMASVGERHRQARRLR